MKKSLRQFKWVQSALIALCLTVSAVPVSYAAQKDVMKNVQNFLVWNTPVTVTVDGQSLKTQGVMINTQILVPFRAVFEAAGAAVSWDESSSTAKADGNGWSLKQKLDSEEAVFNGHSITLDHPSMLADGQLMISIRAAQLALKQQMNWDSAARTVSFSKPSLPALTVSTTAFAPYDDIPGAYSKNSQNKSIPLEWSGAPKETKSFAVVMYDPHPIADNYVHWLVTNIPVTENQLAEGVSGSIAGASEPVVYYGPQPPLHSGDHTYRMAVYALDADQIDFGKPVFFEEIQAKLQEHALAYGFIDGYFK